MLREEGVDLVQGLVDGFAGEFGRAHRLLDPVNGDPAIHAPRGQHYLDSSLVEPRLGGGSGGIDGCAGEE